MKDQLTRKGVADLLGVSERTVSNYIESGKLPKPYLTINRVHYWKPSQIAAHLGVDVQDLGGLKRQRAAEPKPSDPPIQHNEFERVEDSAPKKIESRGIWGRLRFPQ
jgi:hypothetical protein